MKFEAMDEAYMREALDLARRGLGWTSPNPMVGALVVLDGRVIGRGSHRLAGTPHAEILALAEAKDQASGTTLYTTLEPCNHFGLTGPCTEAILAARVSRVVMAMRDPDPRVDGRGVRVLREANVDVTEGILAGDAARLNEAYVKQRSTGLPFVTLKWGMSLDGKIAERRDAQTRISGQDAWEYVYQLRHANDAVLVGINTVLADDPRLTARIDGGRHPTRVVLDSQLRIPLTARVLRQPSEAPTLIVASEAADPAHIEAVRATGVEVLVLPGNRPSLRRLMEILGARKILSVLIEGGGRVHASALAEGVVDKVVAMISPTILGGMDAPVPVEGPLGERVRLQDVAVRNLGEDVVLEGYLSSPPSYPNGLAGVEAGAREASART